MIEFLVKSKVKIVASLPYYSADNVNKQRGSSVFDRSIITMLAFIEAGYGKSGSRLYLDFVYNPLSVFLPPLEKNLEL